jgi:hypothetical protein
VVGHLSGEGQLVSDDHHGHAAAGQRAHDLQHALHQLGVERGGRLVEQHHTGAHGQRAGDGRPLLLPAGQLARPAAGKLAQAQLGQVLAAQLLGVGPRHAADVAQAEGRVVQHAHVREQVEVLEHHADARSYRVQVHAGGGHLLVADDDSAGGRLLQPVDAAQQGRLARTRRADDAGRRARRHFQRDAA